MRSERRQVLRVLAGSLEATLMWTVRKVVTHLLQFDPDAIVFFQDRLGREIISHEDIGGVESLDVVIGVLEPSSEGDQ